MARRIESTLLAAQNPDLPDPISAILLLLFPLSSTELRE